MRYAVCLSLLIFCGCSYLKPKPETLLETEYFPVKVTCNGVPLNLMSINDLMKMTDFNDVIITSSRKGTTETATDFTHYLITPRAIDRLRPK